MFKLPHWISPDYRKVAEHQLKEARLQRLDHEKAAEYHQAVADMLKRREARLEAIVEEEGRAGIKVELDLSEVPDTTAVKGMMSGPLVTSSTV